ncbi:hypothetical protein FQZ97_1105820 [compost metagenome]
MVGDEAARFDVHYPERQADQGMEYFPAAPVFGFKSSAFTILGRVVVGNGRGKLLQYSLAMRFPILALEEHDEIVAADVADEIAVGIAVPA